MKKTLRRLAALGLSALLLASSALALTPQELGEILKNEYAGEVPAQVWEQTTVDGMLQALGDPYTRYYTPEGYAKFKDAVNGATTGSAEAKVSLAGAVGQITLASFGAGTYASLKSGIEANHQAGRWIVDLRGNPGGELRAAVDAMSAFVGKGQLVFLRDGEDALFSAKSDKAALTLSPAVVLVNGSTASAAELFAATLRDRQKALIVGSRTYGKGVAQTAFDRDSEKYASAFSDGSALLLSTERVFSEGMNSHNIMGVIPHLVVDDAMAEPVAKLLCGPAPTGSTGGCLRLNLAHWRWYIDPNSDAAALKALVEALPPQAELFVGTGGEDGWQQVSPEEYGRANIPGYTPRVFTDVSASPYAGAINALKTYGILKGDEAGLYHPSGALTRASLCALLAQAMHYPMSSAAPAFADTPAGAWYTPYVTTLSAMGIVNGYSDGLFHPDDPIPHQQFMTILARIAANTNCASFSALKAGPDEQALASGDYAAYDAWAVPGAWLLDGLWHADAKDIDPKATTTREEAACDLWTMLFSVSILPG